MRVTKYRLTLHDHLYYATREIGRLYETEAVIHNWALTYALGLVEEGLRRAGKEGKPSFSPDSQPHYREELRPVNGLGVYVTPARPVQVDFVLHTFKLANNRHHVVMSNQQLKAMGVKIVNKPSYGRAKEIAVGSIFEFYVMGLPPRPLPRWVRLGLWMSKAAVEPVETWDVEPQRGDFACTHPLNPLDLPVLPKLYDLIVMPPVSLVRQARLHGNFIELTQGRWREQLPLGMGYFANESKLT
jgi:CRISPR-associated protein Csc1